MRNALLAVLGLFGPFLLMSAIVEPVPPSAGFLEREPSALEPAPEPDGPELAVRSWLTEAIAAEGLEWDEGEIDAAVDLCWLESRFDPYCQNARSSAYGLYQFLDSTWGDYGCEKSSDPYLQTVAFVRYVKGRYSTPTKALAWWKELHTVDGRRVHYY